MNETLTSKKEEQLEHLMNQYGDQLLRLCYLYLKDYHLAEDALQETFLKVYQHLDEFRKESSEKTWMVRIAINTCKNMMRRNHREDTYEDSWLEQIPDQNTVGHLVNQMCVLAEIGRLPVKYREVILLHYYQELSTKEIAMILHVPNTTVSCRLKNAKKRLSHSFQEGYIYE